jgi:hypothetical protein
MDPNQGSWVGSALWWSWVELTGLANHWTWAEVARHLNIDKVTMEAAIVTRIEATTGKFVTPADPNYQGELDNAWFSWLNAAPNLADLASQPTALVQTGPPPQPSQTPQIDIGATPPQPQPQLVTGQPAPTGSRSYRERALRREPKGVAETPITKEGKAFIDSVAPALPSGHPNSRVMGRRRSAIKKLVYYVETISNHPRYFSNPDLSVLPRFIDDFLASMKSGEFAHWVGTHKLDQEKVPPAMNALRSHALKGDVTDIWSMGGFATLPSDQSAPTQQDELVREWGTFVPMSARGARLINDAERVVGSSLNPKPMARSMRAFLYWLEFVEKKGDLIDSLDKAKLKSAYKRYSQKVKNGEVKLPSGTTLTTWYLGYVNNVLDHIPEILQTRELDQQRLSTVERGFMLQTSSHFPWQTPSSPSAQADAPQPSTPPVSSSTNGSRQGPGSQPTSGATSGDGGKPSPLTPVSPTGRLLLIAAEKKLPPGSSDTKLAHFRRHVRKFMYWLEAAGKGDLLATPSIDEIRKEYETYAKQVRLGQVKTHLGGTVTSGSLDYMPQFLDTLSPVLADRQRGDQRLTVAEEDFITVVNDFIPSDESPTTQQPATPPATSPPTWLAPATPTGSGQRSQTSGSLGPHDHRRKVTQTGNSPKRHKGAG